MPNLTLEYLFLCLFFVAPGFIAIQTYSLWHPGQKREWQNAWTEVVVYSLLIFIGWSLWIMRLLQPGYAANHPYEFMSGAAVICFVSPVVLASVLSLLRKYVFPKWVGMDHPTRTAWDYYVQHHKAFFALFHLKSGGMVGGLYMGDSYASTYPIEPEMYVEALWNVDDQGRFLEPKSNTLGLVIRFSECELIEFFKVVVNTNGKNHAPQAGQLCARIAAGGQTGTESNGTGTNGQSGNQPNHSATGGNGSGQAADRPGKAKIAVGVNGRRKRRKGRR